MLDNKLDQFVGGDGDMLGHLARMRIQEVWDLNQWTVQQVHTWIPGVHKWDGLPPGLLSQELPQIGRIVQVAQSWTAFDSKRIMATVHVRRTCQIMQL